MKRRPAVHLRALVRTGHPLPGSRALVRLLRPARAPEPTSTGEADDPLSDLKVAASRGISWVAVRRDGRF